MTNSSHEDSKVIFLDPERQFSSSRSLADVLIPYLKQEVMARFSEDSALPTSEYNEDTHQVVSHQGGAA
jgi:hypothetical protein